MKRLLVLACAAITLLVCSTRSDGAIVRYEVSLDGRQEVDALGAPDKGDLNGSGVAQLFVNTDTQMIDWNITAQDIDFPLIGAHIHEAAAGANGSVKIDFNAQLVGAGVADADITNLLANPTGFYVNLHNAAFPTGAIRGQIGQPVPEPTTLFLASFGLVALAVVRRRQ